MIRNKLIGIIGLIFVLLFISCVSLSSIEFPSKTTPATSAPLQTQKVPGEIAVIDLSTQQNIFAELYEKVDPGVVAIRVLSKEGQGLGSGFVIDKEGHIITNYHVVRSAKELEIDFPSGYKTRAEILGTDSDSDIAVLKVEAPSDELFPIPLGDSDLTRVGQIVVAIGNPRGLDSTMTTGIISAKGRTMSSLHEAPGGGSFTAGGIIQTDAAINPGNSGGPLLNLNGDVIGVNVAIQTTSFDITGQPINSGIGFAVPINIVKRVVPALIKEGKYDYPYLGIRTLDEITLIQQEALGLPQASGVYVIDVTPDSPADRAGLRGGKTNTKIANLLGGGDLITAINNFPVRDFNDLITYLIHNKQPGDNVTLTVLRDKEQINLNLTLGKRP
ncbi:MAG TPA: PDZ domain-containing protein [Anaerolineae bacterium]|nr:PDZ domain-containing protein [Anaerolineae bacterium]